MAERLFSDAPRIDFAKNSHGRSTSEFLDRTADPAFSRVRDLLEAWFAAYPEGDDDKKDLRRRLTKNDDAQFHAAFFELYLFALHRALGFAMEGHPTLAGVGTHADFRATRADGAFLLEATIPDQGPAARGREQRRAEVVDAINRIESPDFGIIFDIEAEGAQAPAMRDVVRRTRRWLTGLDWSEIRARQTAEPRAELPSREDHAGAWTFSFRAWPRSPEARGQGHDTITMGPSDGGVFAHDETLRARLERKAKKYGTEALDEPLVIAVRVDGMGADDRDVATALYGPSVGTWNPAKRTVERTPRRGEGLWQRDGAPRNRQVTAVLAYDTELRPWSVSRVRPTLWRNPDASCALPELPWDQAVLGADGQVMRIEGAFDPSVAFVLPSVGDVEGGPERWPGPAFVG